MNAAESKTLAKITINHTDETTDRWTRVIGLNGPDGKDYDVTLTWDFVEGYSLEWETEAPSWADDLDLWGLDDLTA